MKKVLVTGATGFLGQYVVKRLLRENYLVIGFARNNKIGNDLVKMGALFKSGDFFNYDEIKGAMDGIDIVIHCGALSTVWGRWLDFYNTNVCGTKNVIKACEEKGVSKLIFISSPSIYSSKNNRFNISENDFDKNNEMNFYIKSKLMAEELIKNNKNKNLSKVIIRPRGIFGIGDTSILPRIININKKFRIPLVNKGENLVDITFVENVAHCIFLCCETENIDGEVFNLTNNEPMKYIDILNKVFNEIKVTPRYINVNFSILYNIAFIIEKIFKIFNIYKEPLVTTYTCSVIGLSQTLNINNAEKKLSYKPIFTIDEGVKLYGNWWRENK